MILSEHHEFYLLQQAAARTWRETVRVWVAGAAVAAFLAAMVWLLFMVL